MAYNKQNFKSKEKLYASQLNAMDDQIAKNAEDVEKLKEEGTGGGGGADGITPHIGANGNWFLGDTDTGVKAQGPKGDPGSDYILTEADKTEIAEEAADIVDDALSEVIGDPSGTVPAVPGYIAMGMTGAAVGMVARVKSVDADGKPTAWEPVEMPEGGGGSGVAGEANEWKHMCYISVTENIDRMLITADDNGEPFAWNELAVVIKAVKREETVSSLKVGKNRNNTTINVDNAYYVLQINTLGYTSKEVYYRFVSTVIGDYRNTGVIESNGNPFTQSYIGVAYNIYSEGNATYQNKVKDAENLIMYAQAGFLAGDIIDVWYR